MKKRLAKKIIKYSANPEHKAKKIVKSYDVMTYYCTKEDIRFPYSERQVLLARKTFRTLAEKYPSYYTSSWLLHVPYKFITDNTIINEKQYSYDCDEQTQKEMIEQIIKTSNEISRNKRHSDAQYVIIEGGHLNEKI